MTITFDSKKQLSDLVYFSIVKDIIVKFVPNNVDSDIYCIGMANLDKKPSEASPYGCDIGTAIYKRTDDPDHPELILSIMKGSDMIFVTLNGIDPSIVFRIEIEDSGAFDFKSFNIDNPKISGEKREAAEYVFNIVTTTLYDLAEKF